MADVAAAAGVHQTTVSLAFRRHPSIPEATRERLIKISGEMGYRPNPLVSALMGQIRHRRTRLHGETIAYVTSHPSKNSWRQYAALREMFAGAEEKADELGFRIEEFDLGAEDMTAIRLKGILMARGIRGMVIAPLPDGQTDFPLELSEFAVVSLGRSIKTPLLERIANDHFQSMQLAFAECLRHGYKRIGFVAGRAFSERLEGYWLGAYLHEREKLPVRRRLKPLLLEEWKLPSEERMKALRTWALRERPDAVISPLGAAQEEWLPLLASLPSRPGVASLTLPSSSGPCAGIFQDVRRFGKIAVERVVSRLYHNDFGSLDRIQNIMLHGSWCNGESLPIASSRR